MGNQCKRLAKPAAALLAAFCLLSPAQAQDKPDERLGLWHAYSEEDSSTLFFLVYNGRESKLYDPDWNRVLTTFETEGNRIHFPVPTTHRKQSVTATFEEGGLKGVFERTHVQFPAKAPFRGRRVSPDPEWEPWAFLKKAEASVISPWAEVIEKAPLDDPASFRSYWLREVESRYYALFTHTLYATETGFFSAELREEALEAMFSNLKKRGDRLKELAQKFKALTTRTAEDLRKLYPWLETLGHIIPLPGREPFDFQIRVLSPLGGNPRPFLVFDLNWMAEALEPVQARYQVAQGLVAFDHVLKRPHPPFFRNEFVVRGIAAYLASRLDYAETPAAYLYQNEGLSEDERLAEFKRFGTAFMKSFEERRAQASLATFFTGEHRAEAYLFGYGFAARLAQRYSERELVRDLDYGRVRDEMLAYMRSLKEPPDPSKPKAEETPEAEGKAKTREHP